MFPDEINDPWKIDTLYAFTIARSSPRCTWRPRPHMQCPSASLPTESARRRVRLLRPPPPSAPDQTSCVRATVRVSDGASCLGAAAAAERREQARPAADCLCLLLRFACFAACNARPRPTRWLLAGTVEERRLMDKIDGQLKSTTHNT